MNESNRDEDCVAKERTCKTCGEATQKQTLLFIDATPDAGYVTRILSAYIDDSYYSDNTIGLPPENALVAQMNEWRENRNALIRDALARLSIYHSPMSAEVEKAIETVQLALGTIAMLDEREEEMANSAMHALDLIVAALKEKV